MEPETNNNGGEMDPNTQAPATATPATEGQPTPETTEAPASPETVAPAANPAEGTPQQ